MNFFLCHSLWAIGVLLPPGWGRRRHCDFLRLFPQIFRGTSLDTLTKAGWKGANDRRKKTIKEIECNHSNHRKKSNVCSTRTQVQLDAHPSRSCRKGMHIQLLPKYKRIPFVQDSLSLILSLSALIDMALMSVTFNTFKRGLIFFIFASIPD